MSRFQKSVFEEGKEWNWLCTLFAVQARPSLDTLAISGGDKEKDEEDGKRKGKNSIWKCLSPAGSGAWWMSMRKSTHKHIQQLVRGGYPAGGGTPRLHRLSLSSPGRGWAPVQVHVREWRGKHCRLRDPHTRHRFSAGNQHGSLASDRKPLAKFAWRVYRT